MDLESKAVQTDTMFRIMSMTKPIVGTAILMMMEEGKVRPTDPVSKFMPGLKGLQVAMPQPGQGATSGCRRPALPHRARGSRSRCVSCSRTRRGS
jgi:CubicO group peptidase (beta-lactamase class C family)